jgi:diguanylate cyclase (GGDEF)-like protein/PAS domain S-box-containing protein
MTSDNANQVAIHAGQLADLHAATLRLLNLLTVQGVETGLLQEGVELLAALVGTRYAAIGIVDEAGQLRQFVHTGVAPDVAARIARLPEGKGLLGVVIQENQVLRLEDMARDPRAAGFPPNHPPMRSLLAVPVSHAGTVYGRVYLSEKTDATPFTDTDEQLVTRFAEALALALRVHRAEGERRRAQSALQDVAHAVSGVTGEEFFRTLVLDLARALDVDYAFVGKIADGRDDAVQTVAVNARGRLADNFIYQLKGTPCLNVVGKAPCQYPRHVQQQFPDDRLLQEMGVESYVGCPLFDSAGRALGLLVVMDGEPIRDPQAIQAILKICAARAATELERQQQDSALRESEARQRALLEAIPDLLFRLRADGTCLDYKPARDFPTYVPPEAFLGRKVGEVLPPEVAGESLRLIARALETRETQHHAYRLVVGGETRDYEARITPVGPDEVLAMVHDVTGERRTEAQRRQLASAVEQAGDSVLITDVGGFIEYVNPAFERNTGWRREEVVGRTPALLKSGRHDKVFYQKLWDTLKRGEVFRAVFVNRRKDGSLFHEEKAITPLKDAAGRITHFVSAGRDITERKQAEDKIARLGRILDDSSNEIYVFSGDDLRFLQVNHGAQRNLGYGMGELRNLTPLDLKPEFTRESFETLIAPLRSGEKERLGFTTVHRRRNGSTYPVEVQLQLMRHESPPVFVAIIQDITERLQAEARLNFLAYHDVLTGLPNRTLLIERLRQAMADADRVQRLVVVMFLDIDRFKVVNDTLGHPAGDALLVSAAERLSATLRAGDTVARLGGDEFTIVLANVAHVDDVARVARKILDCFVQPFRIGDRDVYTSTSIGITLYPFDVQEPEGLLKNADAAMYHAKEHGRANFQFFTAELNARAERRLRLETALRTALDKNQISLHYQPQVDTKTGRITGMEALARWTHPELGSVSPAEFIPLAEETGLILPIGEWVLREACRQVKAWHATKFSFSKMQVAVNISGKQLHQRDFADLVLRVLEETKLDPRYLDLELTESLLMKDAEGIADAMHMLHDLGVSFSVDDFGTGYSSLAYLKRFPIDILKIDRSFVRDLATDPNDVAIVRTIIAMAHTLGMRVVAEGVETHEQLRFLRAQDCDSTQGYYCSAPLSAGEFSGLLEDWGRIRRGRCTLAKPRRRTKPRPAGRRKRGK